MSYDQALAAAGVEVIEFEMFGSWQGDWLCLIRDNGVLCVAEGSFGSCDYCDAFQAEFDYYPDDTEEGRQEYLERLADFGRGYLPAYTLDEMIAKLERTIAEYSWGDYEEMLEKVKSWKESYN